MTNNEYHINIRYAESKDASAIATVHVRSWQKIYRGHIPDEILDNLSIEKRTQSWIDIISKDVMIAILEIQNKIIGFVSICAARDSDKDTKQCGEISSIYLDPDYWQQGFGKVLCSFALSKLKDIGYNEVIVWVVKGNKQARQFYESLGFVLDGKEEINNLSACTLGVVVGEKTTENVNVALHEIRYCIRLPNF